MIYWIAATFAAFFVKGLCGFANTLVFNSILSFGINNINITPVELLLGYPANLILAFLGRKKVDWKMCGILSLMVMLGCIPGALLLKGVDASSVKLLFGLVIIGIGIEMLVNDIRHRKGKMSKLALVLIGIASGILCGLYGIGALLATYISKVTDGSDSFKANMSVVFFVENTWRVILYTASGILTIESAKRAIVLIPIVLLGLFCGIGSSKILNEKLVKRIVLAMLIVSGGFLVFQAIG